MSANTLAKLDADRLLALGQCTNLYYVEAVFAITAASIVPLTAVGRLHWLILVSGYQSERPC